MPNSLLTDTSGHGRLQMDRRHLVSYPLVNTQRRSQLLCKSSPYVRLKWLLCGTCPSLVFVITPCGASGAQSRSQPPFRPCPTPGSWRRVRSAVSVGGTCPQTSSEASSHTCSQRGVTMFDPDAGLPRMKKRLTSRAGPKQPPCRHSDRLCWRSRAAILAPR